MMRERDVYTHIVEIFDFRGRICMIRRVIMPLFNEDITYHNGYVEKAKNMYGKGYYDANVEGVDVGEEITFDGSWSEFKGREFWGFDTMHSYDTKETQSHKAVKERLLKFAEEIIASGL